MAKLIKRIVIAEIFAGAFFVGEKFPFPSQKGVSYSSEPRHTGLENVMPFYNTPISKQNIIKSVELLYVSWHFCHNYRMYF